MQADATRVHDEIRQNGPLAAFQRLITENDALIRSSELSNGRTIASARTAIYTGHLRGYIFGLSAHAARGRAYVSVHHRLPRELSLDQAQAIVARHF